MSTYNQGAPSTPLVLSASNISAFGNAATGNALTVQQLGSGPVVSFSNAAGQSFVMNANGQVGIGTTSPGTTLQVYSTGTIVPLSVITASNTVYAIYTSANQGIGTGVGATQPQIQTYQPVGGNNVYLNLFGRRHTAGTDWTGVSQRIQHQVDTTPMGYIDFNPSLSAQGLALGNGTTEYVRMSSAGNVGIGTNNPTAGLLQVAGMISTVGLTVSQYGASSAPNAQGGFFSWNRTGALLQGATSFMNQQGAGSGGWEFVNYNGSNQLTANCAFLTALGGLTLGTYSNAYQAPVGGLICPGNVGIGTTNPAATLDVRGGVRAQASAPSYVLSDGTYTAQFGLASSAGAYSPGAQAGDAVIRTGQPNNSNIILTGSTTFSTQFIVQGSSGNVGIGTASPGYLLDVNSGDIRVCNGGNVGGAGGSIYFNANPAQNPMSQIKGYLVTDAGSVTEQGGLSFLTRPAAASALTQRMYISDQGYVGIGTASPGVQLDLSTDGARKLTTSTWATGSDQRIKTDIQSANLHMCYDVVKAIDLKYFKWNFPESSNVALDDKHSLGFIAQEVKTVFPNAVYESNSYGFTDFLSLNTDQILKAMYGALKQTIADKEALEQSLATATANFSSLEARLAALEQRDAAK